MNAMETIFNATYLAILIAAVIYMCLQIRKIETEHKQIAKLFIIAFSMLCIGDFVHLVTRTIAIASGSIAKSSPLVGLGEFITAITFTIFFIIMTQIWCKKTSCTRNPLWWILIFIGVFRLIILLLPMNCWLGQNPAKSMLLLRNSLLILQGISVGVTMVLSYRDKSDRIFKSLGIIIILSFISYLPAFILTSMQSTKGTMIIVLSFTFHTICYIIMAFITMKWFKTNKLSQ